MKIRFQFLKAKFASLMMTAGLCVLPAHAADFSFTGDFTFDDTVQLFNFTVGSTSNVTLRSYSYAGGVNAAGQTITGGGFDPILALFDGSGALLEQQDDAGCGTVPGDAITGSCWDVSLTRLLAPGNYTVSIMQYDNFANGPNLTDGFTRTGHPTFTQDFAYDSESRAPFVDASGHQRDSHWAFDVLGVSQASMPGGTPGDVPEPASVVIVLSGISAIALLRRRN